MTSALTTTVLAAPGLSMPSGSLVACYPLEDASGTTSADVGPNSLSVLTGTGGVASNGGAVVAGAAGSWAASGASSTYLSRTVSSGDAMRLSTAMGFGLGFQVSTAPGASTAILGLANSWRLNIAPYSAGSAYSSTTAYLAGTLVTYSGLTYIAITGSTNVTPGTNSAVWLPLCLLTLFGYTANNGIPAVNSQFLIPIGQPVYAMGGWSGSELSLFINGVKDFCELPTVTGTDTLNDPTGTFYVAGEGGATSLNGNVWGLSLWNVSPTHGLARSLYEAMITSADLITPGAAWFDNPVDAITPATTAETTVYECAECGHKFRSNVGYRSANGKKYHRGCWEAAGVNVTPAVPAVTPTPAAFADRAQRVMWQVIQAYTARSSSHKAFYHDGTVLQPVGTVQGDARFQSALGAGAAVLARYSKTGKGSFLVGLASKQMEYAISTQWGIPAAWLGPGVTSIAPNSLSATLTSPYPTATSYGSYEGLTSGGATNHHWILQKCALLALSIRRYVSPSTLSRWLNSLVAGGEFLWYGSWTQASAQSDLRNMPYYVNGNYALRYSNAFYLLWLLTGDQVWYQRWQACIAWTLYPYGQALHWQGVWAATTSYATNNIAGPDAVTVGGTAYVCIAAIAGSSGNASPATDTTHWTPLSNTVAGEVNANNQYNWNGYGLVKTAGSSSTGDDWTGWLAEWAGSGSTLGPPGPLYGQPGYDGDYTILQSADATLGYLISGDVRYRQLANMLINQLSLYPAGGGSGNPQSSVFNYSAQYLTTINYNMGTNGNWNLDCSSGASGGYCTRHNVSADAMRTPWLQVAIASGWRNDLTTAFAASAFSWQGEPAFRQSAGATNGATALEYLDVYLAPLLIAAPTWPGF